MCPNNMHSVQSYISMQLSSQVIAFVSVIVIQVQRTIIEFMKTVFGHQMCPENLRNHLHFDFRKHFKCGLSKKNICWHRHFYYHTISFIIELLATTTTMTSKMQVTMMGKVFRVIT